MQVLDKWLEWLDKGGPAKTGWALAYLEHQNVQIVGGRYSDYDKVVATIKSMCESKDFRLFMRGMRSAWSQKIYRDKLKENQAATYNHVMTKTVRKQLKGIAHERKCTLNAALNWCIEAGARTSKEDNKEIKELRKQHAEQVKQLQIRLADSERLNRSLEGRCKELRREIESVSGISIEDIQQLPVLKAEVDVARRKISLWEKQADDWLKSACDWEVLCKAHALEGFALNPDQASRAQALRHQRLAGFSATLKDCDMPERKKGVNAQGETDENSA